MKHVIFGNRNLDAFLTAIITYHKLAYDGEKDILVYPFLISYIYDNLKSGDTAVFIGVSLHPDKPDELVKEKNVNVVCIEHNKKFVDELDCTFVDWHNMNYMLLSEAATHDVYDKLDFFKTNSPVGWRTYFANNKVENKPVHIKRSTSGIVRDVILSNNPGFENFLSTFMRSDYATLIEQSQIHELWLHNGYERCGSYLVNQWFKYWYNENKDAFLNMKSNLLTPNDFFNQVRTSFLMTSFQEKADFGHEQLMKTKVKTRELAMSDDVQRVEFRHVEIRDMKACYVKNPLVSTLGESIVGNELVKEHGWDVVVLDGPLRSDVRIYFLYSNPDGADIDVL